jgi:hypothetical protein
MPYSYYGDISGTLDETLCIYTLENLGIEAEKLYTWTCGCKTLYEELSECDCELEGENVQSSEPSCIEYHVSDYHIDIIKEALDEIVLEFGEDREEFFNMMLDPLTGSSYNFTEEQMNTYKELYALYKFGNMLYEYLVDTPICILYFDV